MGIARGWEKRVIRTNITYAKLWAYLLKLEKNLSWDFEVIFIFRKNEVLNICLYLKSFYTYKKMYNIFSKFHQYLLMMQKIVEIGWIFYSEKRESKT